MGVQGLTSLLYSRSERAQSVSLVTEATRRRQSQPNEEQSQQNRSPRGGPHPNHTTTAYTIPPSSSSFTTTTGPLTHTSLLLDCFARHPQSLFVLVDGLGVFHELTHVDAIAARTLPAYDMLHARVTALVQSLRSVGVELIVYFDTSSTETTKQEEIHRRAEGRVSHNTTLHPTASACCVAIFRRCSPPIDTHTC